MVASQTPPSRCDQQTGALSLNARFSSIRDEPSGTRFPEYVHGAAECGSVAKHHSVRSENAASLRPSSDLVFEHDLGSNTVLSAAYLFSAGHDFPTFIDVNLPAPTSRTYTIIGGDFDGQTLTVSPFFGGPRPDSAIWHHHGDSGLIKSMPMPSRSN